MILLASESLHSPGAAPDLIEYLSILERSEEQGLDPEDYQFASLAAAHRSGSPANEIALENSFRRFVRSLARGRVEPAWLGPGWERSARDDAFDSAGLYARFLRGEALNLDLLGPQDERFRRLRDALKYYRELRAHGGWIALPPKPTPVELAERLTASGDLTTDARDAAALTLALQHFQLRHGLYPDGVVGRETLKALNVTIEERIEQIEFNLERWRWLPQTLESKFVEVNIPSYELTAYEHGRPVLRMRVIVGKSARPTPVIRSEITAMEINPDWDVPESIATREMLPILKRDPGYLSRNHMVVLDQRRRQINAPADWHSYTADDFPYRLRQVPGPWNSVGPLKFVFKSRYGVYLHGTPAKELFAKVSRRFSHGCIRIEDPLALAEFAFAGSAWTRGQIERSLSTGNMSTVQLPGELPLYVNYWTAWVDEEGTTHFAEDIYGGDAGLRRQIQRWRSRNPRADDLLPHQTNLK